MKFESKQITNNLIKKLIQNQFPEYKNLPVCSVQVQGHDNRTFRLGKDLLVRLPSAKYYALKVPKENKLLPLLKPHITLSIPEPVKVGMPSDLYPYNFSIYKWLEGKSANLINFSDKEFENIAFDLANFIKELHGIKNIKEILPPGKHNGWGGGELKLKDKDTKNQINSLSEIINKSKSLNLWEKATNSKWNKKPVWIHGDFAFGNFLTQKNKLSGVIDFGGIATGDPACDLVIAWTFLKNKPRTIFKKTLNYDHETWIRAKGWALWKATFELCNQNLKPHLFKNKDYTNKQIKIIQELLNDNC